MAKVQSWEVPASFWARVEPLVPKPKRDPNKTYKRNPAGAGKPMPARQIFEGIVYVLRTGCQGKYGRQVCEVYANGKNLSGRRGNSIIIVLEKGSLGTKVQTASTSIPGKSAFYQLCLAVFSSSSNFFTNRSILSTEPSTGANADSTRWRLQSIVRPAFVDFTGCMMMFNKVSKPSAR